MNKKIVFGLSITLIALGLTSLPATGATAKKSSPASLIQYKHCLDLYSDESSLYDIKREKIVQFNQFVSLVVLNCASFKPSVPLDAKSIEYAKCLEIGSGLRNNLKIPRDPNTELFDAGSLRTAISYIHEACKQYRP